MSQVAGTLRYVDMERWQAERDAGLRARVDPFLKAWHQSADGLGSLGAWMGKRHPVVVDANVLRNDIRRCVRQGRKTTLLAAGSGALRLLCAQHVVDEVYEHAFDWSDENVSASQLLEVFEGSYLPLVTVVDVPGGLLTKSEQLRIEKLRSRDPDDMPSVTLSMVTGAFYLSEDGNACEAAYGESLNPQGLRAWLEVLRSGSNEQQLLAVTAVAARAGGLMLMGLVQAGRLILREPAALLISVAALIVASGNWNASRTAAVKRVGVEALTTTGAVAHVIQISAQTFRERCVPRPRNEELAADLTARAHLTRELIATFGSSTRRDLSAKELSELLWQVDVAHSPDAVRRVLRGTGCFEEVGRGRWSLGRLAEPRTLKATGPEMSPRMGGSVAPRF